MNQNHYKESLNYLYGLERFGMIFGLEKILAILDAIGNPHREIQAIHIGGTNGKGSTASMIAHILQKEGYKVGLYTSPHLNRFTERIKINGREIDKEEVAELTNYLKERIEVSGVTPPFTFFDFTTAMAFLYFKEKMVDLAVIEVGLGGRLDSTNVLDPLLSIITNISKDHEEQLGRSIKSIAMEKAGIIKRGRPLITAATQPQVLSLFSKLCRMEGSPFYRVGKEFRFFQNGDRTFNYEGINRKLWGININLSGAHQIVNATTALGAMEVLEGLGYPLSNEAMIEGLKEVDWPGRLEMVSSSPRVILDGAHNPAGASVLRESLGKEFLFRRLILIVGIMKDKDIGSFLHILAPLADHIILTRPGIDRAASPSIMKKALGRYEKKSETIENFRDAIDKGISIAGEGDLICITGSLYTVGEARSYFHPMEGL